MDEKDVLELALEALESPPGQALHELYRNSEVLDRLGSPEMVARGLMEAPDLGHAMASAELDDMPEELRGKLEDRVFRLVLLRLVKAAGHMLGWAEQLGSRTQLSPDAVAIAAATHLGDLEAQVAPPTPQA
jgi:hypothetical protein